MKPLYRNLVFRVGRLAAAGVIAFATATLAQAAPPGAVGPEPGDPLASKVWPDLREQYLPRGEPVRFDARVVVSAPPFAEDAMNVPVSVDASALPDVERVIVLVERNPIRKVLEFRPVDARPVLAFRFKLEQASEVRAAARTRDGVWHVGSTRVDAAGGGCTAPGATRADGSWSRTLGQVQARLFAGAGGAGGEPGTRLRIRVMHPMDTGLVSGVPAFFLRDLSLLDATGAVRMRLLTYEPVSENPVFSFDFATPPPLPLRLAGVDNNGNRVQAEVGR